MVKSSVKRHAQGSGQDAGRAQSSPLQATAMNRRNFVKAGGAAAGLAALAGTGMLATQAWVKQATAADADSGAERTMHLAHQFHCLTGCNLKCTVRDERVCMIEPSDLVDDDHKTICLRGIGEIDHIYSAWRLQTPMKRTNPNKGENEDPGFVEISWDEAIQTICDQLKATRQKYGQDSIFIRKSTEASIYFDFFGALMKATAGGNWGLDRGQANGLYPCLGAWSYIPSRSIWEFKDATTLIELGHNPLESGITWSRALLDAKESGTYIVSVDPRFTGTSSKADQWLPIHPGTDSALIQGMIRTIIDKGWYDKEWVLNNTDATFLVDRKTGKNYRDAKAMCPNPTVVKMEQVGKPYVWDKKSGSPKLYDAKGIEPVLEGEWQYKGMDLVTSFTLLKEWIAQYDIDWAAKTCGVEADVIEALADRYANNGPAIIDFGLGGPDKYTNADVLGHSTAILATLTHNNGRKGTGLAFYSGVGMPDPAATLNAWAMPAEYAYDESSGLAMYDYPYKKNNIHYALTFGDAFTLEAGAANDMLNWVKTLDFFAIIDIYHSSAVDYADIVLPACTKFECEENVKQLRDSYGYMQLANGMVRPLFSSKSDLQIERLLATQFGLEKYIPESYEAFARYQLNGAEKLAPNMKGITYENLLANGGCLPYADSGYESYMVDLPEIDTYATPSTRAEMYYETMYKWGQQYPIYENANEAYESNPKKTQYPLYFMQGKSRYRIHAYYSANEWFQEDFGACVNISPKDAADRGIKTGDDIHVHNDRGEFVATALVNPSMQPGVLFMAETSYTSLYKQGFLQNVTNSTRNPRQYDCYHGPTIPYSDVLVQVEKTTV